MDGDCFLVLFLASFFPLCTNFGDRGGEGDL